MPHYDFERGCALVDPNALFKKYVEPVSDRLDPNVFRTMIVLIDGQLQKLKPSKKSQLVWTRVASLVGYSSDIANVAGDVLWSHALYATKKNGDQCNIFVGSLIMWQISLLENDVWLSSKTKDAKGVHPYRMYWINNDFVAPEKFRHATLDNLKDKFQRCHV